MGSPINLITANLFMENFKLKALSKWANLPNLWKRYVNGTFPVIKLAYKSEFL